MLGMIKKDLYLMLNNRKLLYIVLIMYLGMSVMAEQDYTLFIPFLVMMMVFSSFSYDEFNNWHGYGAVLPHGRENIVKAKYVAALGLLIVSGTVSMLLSLAIGSFKHSLDLSNSVSMLAGVCTVMLLLVSILFPIIFKFGYEKGRIAMFVVSFGISGIAILLGKVFQIQISASTLLFLEKYGLYLAVALMLILLYGSYRISRKVYLNKEL
ncbi:MAG: ABC-2 transporter permease [Erysipelotrichaceae bacterium]|nr:ABC-2 transporter permease [Erysipelotrichaceae bacterium]